MCEPTNAAAPVATIRTRSVSSLWSDSGSPVSTYDSDVAETCAGEPGPIEELPAVDQQRIAHFAGESFPREIAILRPLRHKDEGIRFRDYVLQGVAECDTQKVKSPRTNGSYSKHLFAFLM
jgi:hypothetical protein